MNDSKEKLSKKEIRFFKAFELILEILAGIAIAASPALMGLIAAVILYNYVPTQTGYWLSVFIVLLGLLTGILWAYGIRKRKGTLWFISQVHASPELDDAPENQPEN